MKLNDFLFNITIEDTKQYLRLYQILISIFLVFNLLFSFSDLAKLYNFELVNKTINQIYTTNYFPSNYFPIILSIYFVCLFYIIFNKNNLLFSFIVYYIHFVFINSSYLFSYGADFMITFVLFLNLLISFSNTKIIKKEAVKNNIRSFIIRFAQIQLCIIYFFAGFGKITGFDWLNGNAVKYLILFYSENFISILNLKIVLIFLGLFIMILELLYFILIYNKKTNKITLLSIIFLHISIFFIMQLYTFALIMILLNFIAFSYIIIPNKLAMFYDNFCPNCTKFGNLVQKLNWLKLVQIKQLRNEFHTNSFSDIDLSLAKQQMASFGTKWHYGYNSLYFIFARLPLFWLFMPFLYILKITTLGQLMYSKLSLKRKIIPIHCDAKICDI